MVRIPDGLTVRITTNAKKKTTRILAYRKGGFKRAYEAILPMCTESKCSHARVGPHALEVRYGRYDYWTVITTYHQRDIPNLVRRIIKSYS